MNKMLSPGEVPTHQEMKPRKKTSGFRGLVYLLITFAAIAAGYEWWRSAAPAPAPQPHGRHGADGGISTIRADAVTLGDMSVALDGLGTVTSLATVTVKTQIAGKITQIGFTEGQAVKAGDFLLQIDPQPYQAVLDQAEAALARDQATLAEANIDLTRFTNLLKQDSIASQQVDTQKSLVKQSEATVQSDKAAIEAAKINLAYCRIVSPVSGRAGLRLVDLGNYVQPGDTSGLVVITQTKPISVIFALAQDTIPQFLTKLRSGEVLPVRAFDRTGSTLLATGQLSSVDSQIDTTTGTVRLRAEFANANEELFPNQFVNVKLVVNTLHNAALVPVAGVQTGVPGAYVYLVNNDNTVSVRPIKLGPGDAAHTVVLEGLSVGDKVVVDGTDRLRDGAKVIVSTGARGNWNGGGVPADGKAPAAAGGDHPHRHHHDQDGQQGDGQKGDK
jgi:membrane fusion protein, multidrug efflux system